MSYWISTDLDGTLIDHHDYSFDGANEALKLCQEQQIPIILNTSKTFKETHNLKQKIGLDGPIIVENGSALVYSDTPTIQTQVASDQRHQSMIFGTKRTELLSFIDSIRVKYGWQLEGFNDWSIQQISDNTGLSLEESQNASDKQYSEPFLWLDSDENLNKFEQLANELNYKILQGGRFYHLQGNCTKASPLNWLKQHTQKIPGLNMQLPKNATLIALGDGNNDIAMLEVADIAVCVRSPVNDFPNLKSHSNLVQTQNLGPHGWNEAVLKIINL